MQTLAPKPLSIWVGNTCIHIFLCLLLQCMLRWGLQRKYSPESIEQAPACRPVFKFHSAFVFMSSFSYFFVYLLCFVLFCLLVFQHIPFQEFSCQNQGNGLFYLAWTHTVSLWWWPSKRRKKLSQTSSGNTVRGTLTEPEASVYQKVI